MTMCTYFVFSGFWGIDTKPVSQNHRDSGRRGDYNHSLELYEVSETTLCNDHGIYTHTHIYICEIRSS